MHLVSAAHAEAAAYERTNREFPGFVDDDLLTRRSHSTVRATTRNLPSDLSWNAVHATCACPLHAVLKCTHSSVMDRGYIS